MAPHDCTDQEDLPVSARLVKRYPFVPFVPLVGWWSRALPEFCQDGYMGQPVERESGAVAGSELPPGQRLQRGWPVTHYGPVPRFRSERWEFRVFGATADGDKRTWN